MEITKLKCRDIRVGMSVRLIPSYGDFHTVEAIGFYTQDWGENVGQKWIRFHCKNWIHIGKLANEMLDVKEHQWL